MSENIAKQILSQISEGNIVIAIWWKRAIAYILDSIFIVGVLISGCCLKYTVYTNSFKGWPVNCHVPKKVLHREFHQQVIRKKQE